MDTINTFPVGTEVSVQIAHNDVTFTALGIIAYRHLNMGMGLRFTDVQLDQNEILDAWFTELVRD